MASPMDLCSEIYDVIGAVGEKDSFEQFKDFVHLDMLGSEYAPSITDASMTSPFPADSPLEHARSTTAETSEVTSNASPYDLDQDDLMHGAGANSGGHASGTGQQPELDRAPLILFPRLNEKHEERAVTDRPASLPPGLVAPVTTVPIPSERAIAPKPGPRPQPAPITSWVHGSPPPPPEVPQGRSPRPRTVHDRHKTAEVRAAKSCLHCSIHKRSCDVGGPCAACFDWDPENHGRVCIRPGKPNAILQSGRCSILDGGRWAPQPNPRLAPLNEHLRTGGPISITVYFSPYDLQGLAIAVAKYADGSLRVLGGCAAFEAEILEWAERDLGKASCGDFQRSVEAFLYLYSQRDYVEKKSLVDSVVRMSSLWRLLSASELYYTPVPGVQPNKQLPLSIVAELKTFARRKMAQAEEKVIDEISHLIPDAFCKENVDAPVVWASLWSVIVAYRQALQMVDANAIAVRDGFVEVTRRLLDALILILSDHFRTRKKSEAVDSISQWSFLAHRDVTAAFEQARLERLILYQELRTTRCYGDDLIEKHVVQQEQDVMKRKKPKGAKQNFVV